MLAKILPQFAINFYLSPVESLMIMSLRNEFLRLLREDEVFRYAVLGLLGISDVQSGIMQLADALGKVLGVVG